MEVSRASSYNGGGGEPPPPFAYIFKEQFGYYLFYGMTADEYWRQDADLVIGYRSAFRLRQEYDNQYLWMLGIYVGRAVNGDKSNPYPKKPLPLNATSVRESDKEKANKMQAFMTRFAFMNNKKFDEGGSE